MSTLMHLTFLASINVSSLVTTFLLILLTALIFKYTITPLIKYQRFLSNFPAPLATLPPPIGHTFILETDPRRQQWQFMEWCAMFTCDFLYIWLGPMPILVCITPNAVEAVLKSTAFISKGFMYDYMRPWLHNGLLTSTGEYWRGRRKLLTPAFHFSILKTFFLTMQEQTNILIDVINDKIKDKKCAVLDINDLITNCTLDIICETAMGVHPNAQRTGESSFYVQAVNEAATLMFERMMKPFYWPDWIFYNSRKGFEFQRCLKVLHEFTKEAIGKRREVLDGSENGVLKRLQRHMMNSGCPVASNDMETDSDEKLPLMDLLLAISVIDNEGFPDSAIQEEIDTFMFEGHDTTANAIIWSLYNIAKNPQIQSKLQEEVDRVYSPGGQLQFSDLSELEYLEWTIKETLRMYPPVPSIARTVEKDEKISLMGREYDVPAGIQLNIPIFCLHRDPRLWSNPNIFNPDRFDKLQSEDRHPFAFVPFSAGPRNCIGQKFAMIEEKVILSKILREFQMEAVMNEDVQVNAELILRPSSEVKIKFTKRSGKCD